MDVQTERLSLSRGYVDSFGDEGIEFFATAGEPRAFAGIALRRTRKGPIIMKILADSPTQWLIPENGDGVVIRPPSTVDFRLGVWVRTDFKRRIWKQIEETQKRYSL